MKNKTSTTIMRDSNIELLKILAMFLICICHTTLTLYKK